MCFGGMFGGGGSSSTPQVQQVKPAPAVVQPIEADDSASETARLERARRQSATGRSDTIMTQGSGLTSQAQTGGKQLLGE